MSEEFSRHFVNDEVFAWAVDLARQMTESGGLRWTISPSGAFTPRLVDEQLEKLSEDEQARFRRALERDIVWALESLAGERFYSYKYGHRDLDKGDMEKLLERRKHVRGTLYDDSLAERVLLRRTSKGRILHSLRWHISTKQHDLETGRLESLPYATLQLKTSRPNFNALTPLFDLGIEFESEFLTFDCHVEDLEDLISDLEDLRANLRKLQSKAES